MGEEPQLAGTFKPYYEIYDQVVLRMLPFYPEMHAAVVSAIARKSDDHISVLELGFGTGTLTYRVFKEYPNVEVVGVDSSAENIAKAKEKLRGFHNLTVIESDFKKFTTKVAFDFVISALAIHHLSDAEKQSYFQYIYSILKPGGRFINGDIMKSPNEEEWHRYLVGAMGDEGEHRWQIHKNNKEDRPSTLEDQLIWLKQAGFTNVTVVKQWFNFAVYFGEKSVVK